MITKKALQNAWKKAKLYSFLGPKPLDALSDIWSVIENIEEEDSVDVSMTKLRIEKARHEQMEIDKVCYEAKLRELRDELLNIKGVPCAWCESKGGLVVTIKEIFSKWGIE